MKKIIYLSFILFLILTGCCKPGSNDKTQEYCLYAINDVSYLDGVKNCKKYYVSQTKLKYNLIIVSNNDMYPITIPSENVSIHYSNDNSKLIVTEIHEYIKGIGYEFNPMSIQKEPYRYRYKIIIPENSIHYPNAINGE